MKINRSNAKQLISGMLDGYKTGVNESGEMYYIMTLAQYNELKSNIISNATKELAKYIDKYSNYSLTSPISWGYNASIKTYEHKYALIKVVEDTTEKTEIEVVKEALQDAGITIIEIKDRLKMIVVNKCDMIRATEIKNKMYVNVTISNRYSLS